MRTLCSGSMARTAAWLTSSSVHISRSSHSVGVPDWGEYKAPSQPGSDGVAQKTVSYMVMGTGLAGTLTGVKHIARDFLSVMNPSADVLAMANIEVDIGNVESGNTMIVSWRGKPVFLRHRTDDEIETSVSDDASDMRDPQKDEARCKRPEWMIVLGVCTHLGCVPIANQGAYGGWFCPCHGSHYDISGRIRRGPAPLNLEVPPYYFIDDTKVLIGLDQAV